MYRVQYRHGGSVKITHYRSMVNAVKDALTLGDNPLNTFICIF